jgi:hypothetical protein
MDWLSVVVAKKGLAPSLAPAPDPCYDVNGSRSVGWQARNYSTPIPTGGSKSGPEEVGAWCVRSARRDLCGGRRAIAVHTATSLFSMPYESHKPSVDVGLENVDLLGSTLP